MPPKQSKKNRQAASEFIFKMNVYSVKSLPMNRLAEYMADLATTFGEYKNVHFSQLKTGSVAIKILVDHEAEPKVRQRIREAKMDGSDSDAKSAIHRINKRLADDNGSGDLLDPNGRKLIQFPGVKKFIHPVVGPVRQFGAVDGIPIRVGGRKDHVPVHLESPNGEICMCTTKRDVAQQIAKLLFDKPIRAEGYGNWSRGSDGEWTLESFVINSFEPLDDVALDETVQRLRAIDLQIDDAENLADSMAEIRYGS